MTPKSSTRNVNSPGQAAVPPTPSYSPSVPISLYREVTAELQASKATIDALKNQNQQLAKQNQLLRQEIEKAVQSALTLRQTANALGSIEADIPAVEPPKPTQAAHRTPDPEPVFQLPTMPPRPPVVKDVEAAFAPEDLVIEQDSKPRRKIQLEKASSGELNGWWLGLVIVMIVVTAFGAGFIIVRPLLPSSK